MCGVYVCVFVYLSVFVCGVCVCICVCVCRCMSETYDDKQRRDDAIRFYVQHDGGWYCALPVGIISTIEQNARFADQRGRVKSLD